MSNGFHCIYRKHGERGFSLIEILIVAVLLAIFAGLAAINISEVFQQNRIKATYGELAGIRTAVGFAFDDTAGTFPKLNFLNQNKEFIRDATQPFSVNEATPNFHYMGFPLGSHAGTIYRRWKGSYLGIARPETSDAGNPTATRKAGVARMLIYSEVPNTSGNRNDVVQWPVDAWNHPYVVYLLRISRDANDPRSTPFIDFIRSDDRQADYSVAYVSYGRDGVPGGYTNTIFPPAAEELRKSNQFLYKIAPVSATVYDFEALQETEFDTLRLSGYSEDKFGNPNFIGVVDEGTDDVVIR